MTEIKKNGNEITITIPLTITISLGAPGAAAIDATVAEATRIVPRFSLSSLAQSGFSWKAALSCAMASKLSYGPAGTVEGQASAWEFQSITFVEAIDTQCFVAIAKEVVLVAFRGTENSADWLADFNALPISRSYGRVHRGFYHAFNDVRSVLEAAMPAIGTRKLILTGHSLGGALATIAAAEWLNAGSFTPTAVYTYGQPRVGFSGLKSFLDGKFGDHYSRFVNDTDLVTRVPPGFAHVGKLYHFSPSGQLQETLGSMQTATVDELEPSPLTESEFDELRANLLKARQGHSLHTESIGQSVELEGIVPGVKNHAIDNYIDLISRHG